MVLLLLLALANSLLQSPDLGAQEPPLEGDSGGLTNYPYSQDVGFGGYDAGQQEVVILRIPVTYMVRSPEEHPWGLRLRVPISFGSTPRPKIWKFQIPRLLIGYRFGENLRGVRIKFGLPF